VAEDYSDWVGREEQAQDVLEPARSAALLQTLGRSEPLVVGAPLPLLHHWLYFWDVRPPSGLGIDGHHARGGFLPPVELPRRMWAGGRVRFLAPLFAGDAVTRTSRIVKVSAKDGRTGKLVFVTVEHTTANAAGPCITEEQDLVYREAAAAGSVSRPAESPAPAAPWQSSIEPDAVLLFRYSALTMNGHRIHYDRPYAIDEEAYPALVVQGPLQATLLAALAAERGPGPLATFEYRAQAPAFDGARLYACGQPEDDGSAQLWTQQGAAKNMVATATFLGV
jgi:3-methylfumaryl-CoA hydratase